MEDLECSICMERPFDAKILPCGHSFCNECKQNLLQFNDDGSATLQCPRNCLQVTTIEKDQTLEDVLPTIFAVQEVLDRINKRLQTESVSCPEEHELTMPCSDYCQSCYKTFCNSCSDNHACEESSRIKVEFDFSKNCFQPICREHNLVARHICRKCDNKLICIYCKNRTHMEHEHATLDGYIGNAKEKLTPALNAAERSVSYLKATNIEQQFAEFREKLVEELLIRKIIQVNKFLIRLNDEEAQILNQFDNHTQKFSLEMTETLTAFDEIQKELNDRRIAMLLLTSEQERLIEKLQTIRNTLTFNVDLTDLNADDKLGELQVSPAKNIFNQNGGSNLTNSDVSFENYSPISCNIHSKNVTETIVAGDFREVSKLKSSLLLETECTNDSEILRAVVEENQYRMLKVLLQCSNVDINFKDPETEMTPIMKASARGYVECAKVLIEKDCNIDIQNNPDKLTAVMYASYFDRRNILELLLQHHCDVNRLDRTRMTALMYASGSGNSNCVELLLGNNSNFGMRNNKGETALIIASENGNVECMKLLLKHNCDIDVRSYKGNTALIWASKRGNSEAVKLLLDHNCNIEITDNDKNTALMLASAGGHSACVKLLLERKCSINATNRHGISALIFASLGGHSECVKLLLDHNCNVDYKDRNGNTALTWASTSECITLLEQCAES